MQSRIDEIRAEGGEVLAISPDSAEWNRRVGARLQAGFSILRDEGLKVAEAYGVLDPEAVRPVDNPIPRPATFLVDREGVVRWRHLTHNWRVRPRVERVLAEMRRSP